MLGTRDVLNYEGNCYYWDAYAYKLNYLVVDYIQGPKNTQCNLNLIFGPRNCKSTKSYINEVDIAFNLKIFLIYLESLGIKAKGKGATIMLKIYG